MEQNKQLPEEVEKMIGDIADKLYPNLNVAFKDRQHVVAGLKREYFTAGATAALTDPSIYEKAGLVKEEELDEMTANKDHWYNEWYELQEEIKEWKMKVEHYKRQGY